MNGGSLSRTEKVTIVEGHEGSLCEVDRTSGILGQGPWVENQVVVDLMDLRLLSGDLGVRGSLFGGG